MQNCAWPSQVGGGGGQAVLLVCLIRGCGTPAWSPDAGFRQRAMQEAVWNPADSIVHRICGLGNVRGEWDDS